MTSEDRMFESIVLSLEATTKALSAIENSIDVLDSRLKKLEQPRENLKRWQPPAWEEWGNW